MQLAGARPYAGLPLNARLAIALSCFEGICRIRAIHGAPVSAFLAHLWDFPILDSADAFSGWDYHRPDLVNAGLGDPIPPDVVESVEKSGMDVQAFRVLLGNVVEIIFASLFSSVQDRDSLERLEQIIALYTSLGGTPPRPELYAPASIAHAHGWGYRITAEQRDQWRTLGAMSDLGQG